MSPRHALLSRRNMFRAAAGVGALAVLGPGLTACGSAPKELVTSGPADLTFWTHDDGYVKFFTEAIRAADAATPFDYQLSITKAAAADIVTKIIAQAVAGRGLPDVAGLVFENFARMTNGDILSEVVEPLDDVVADVRSDLIEARTRPFTKDGKLYALDSDSPLVVYYFRDDLFRKFGVPADAGTWQEFFDAARSVSNSKGVALGAVATGVLDQVVTSYAMLAYQRGGRFFDEAGRLDLVSDENVDALEFIVRGLQDRTLVGVTDLYGPAINTALKSGSLIGFWMANWYKAYSLEANVPEQGGLWRIRDLPRFAQGGGRTAVAGGTGFAALRGQPNTVAAKRFVAAAYLEPAQQVKRFLELGYLPTRRSVYNDASLLSIEDPYLGGQRAFRVYAAVIDDAPTYYLSPSQNILVTVLAGNLLRAYRGEVSAPEALRQAADDFTGQVRG